MKRLFLIMQIAVYPSLALAQSSTFEIKPEIGPNKVITLSYPKIAENVYAANALYRLNSDRTYYATALAAYAIAAAKTNPTLSAKDLQDQIRTFEGYATGKPAFKASEMIDLWGTFLGPLAGAGEGGPIAGPAVDFVVKAAKKMAELHEEISLEDFQGSLYEFHSDRAHQVWAEFYRESQKDPRLAKAATIFALKYVKARPSSQISKILADSPEFSEVIDRYFPEDSDKLKKGKAPKDPSIVAEAIYRLIQEKLLRAAADARQAVNQPAPADPLKKAQQIDLEYAEINACLGIVTNIGKLSPDPAIRALSQNVGVLGQQMLTMGNAFEKWANGAATGVMTANIVLGSTVAIMTVFQGMGKTDPVMQGLTTISKAISDLRREMHERFDRIESRLDDVFTTLSEIYRTAGRIEVDLRATKRGLADLSQHLDRSFTNIQAMIVDLGERTFIENSDHCLLYQARYKLSLEQRDVARCVDYFYTYTTKHSRDSLAVGSAHRSLALEDVSSELGRYPSAANLPYIVSLLSQKYLADEESRSGLVASLPNPAKWAAGAYAYTTFLENYIESVRDKETLVQALGGIREDGRHVADALTWIYGEKGKRFDKIRAKLGEEYLNATRQVVDAYSAHMSRQSNELLGGHDLWDTKLQQSDFKVDIPVVETCADYSTAQLKASNGLERVSRKMQFRTSDRSDWLTAGASPEFRYFLSRKIAFVDVCFSDIFVNEDVNAPGFGGLRHVSWKTRVTIKIPNGDNDGKIKSVVLFDDNILLPRQDGNYCGNMEFYATISKCWEVWPSAEKVRNEIARRVAAKDNEVAALFKSQVERLRSNALQDQASRSLELNNVMSTAIRRLDGIRSISESMYYTFFSDEFSTSDTIIDLISGKNAIPTGNMLVQAPFCKPIGADECSGLLAEMSDAIWVAGISQVSDIIKNRWDKHQIAVGDLESRHESRSPLAIVDFTLSQLAIRHRRLRHKFGIGAGMCRDSLPLNLSNQRKVKANPPWLDVTELQVGISIQVSHEGRSDAKSRIFAVVINEADDFEIELPLESKTRGSSSIVVLPISMNAGQAERLGIKLCGNNMSISPGLRISSVALKLKDGNNDWIEAFRWPHVGWIGASKKTSNVVIQDGIMR